MSRRGSPGAKPKTLVISDEILVAVREALAEKDYEHLYYAARDVGKRCGSPWQKCEDVLHALAARGTITQGSGDIWRVVGDGRA